MLSFLLPNLSAPFLLRSACDPRPFTRPAAFQPLFAGEERAAAHMTHQGARRRGIQRSRARWMEEEQAIVFHVVLPGPVIFLFANFSLTWNFWQRHLSLYGSNLHRQREGTDPCSNAHLTHESPRMKEMKLKQCLSSLLSFLVHLMLPMWLIHEYS